MVVWVFSERKSECDDIAEVDLWVEVLAVVAAV